MKNTNPWTEVSASKAIQDFITSNHREPTSKDFATNPHLPNPRLIQRKFGGLKNLRSKLNLETVNFAKKNFNDNLLSSRKQEAKFFNYLHERFHTGHDLTAKEIVYVTRQFQYQQYIPSLEHGVSGYYENTAVDMAISFRNRNHIILIDTIYPQDLNSLLGSVNTKKKKVEKTPIHLVSPCTHDLYFVCLNKAITQEQINKHIKPHKMYTVVAYDAFVRDILDTCQKM